ncbi:membrane protein insertion efficiency factor YidD [Rhodonellum sp.]|uniref:membrane protein insertion efficiency factor YidD n=1 Tax=Rhodonellum sp. TaxID=2231180 RepID=UPI002725C595|nr:membrane protein insertion efficiency factor YidD [Rhodonellum sp.]MDO9553276.1 membrane protein insertion efficiency factor YidD [Rhodonellum sp.]
MKSFILILTLIFLHISKGYGQDKDSSISDLFYIYTDFISDTRGQSCPMYPSCSHYSMQAFSQFGALKGLLLTSDRLIRCGHEQRLYDLNWKKGEPKFEDFPTWEFSKSPLSQRYPAKFSKNITFYDDKNDTTFFLSLINAKDYESAIIEYKRLVHFGEKNKQVLILELNHLIALNAIGEHEKLIFYFENRLEDHIKKEPEILLELADARFRLNNFEDAISTLTAINLHDKYYPYKNLLSGVSYAYLNNYEAALTEFNDVDQDFIYLDYAKSNVLIINSIETFKRKKPYIAGVLGLVPGGGYFYAGQNTTGLTSLILTGLMGYASYTSFKTGNHGVGILAGIFTVTFYSGSITGGINSIKRQNLNKEKNLKSKLLYITQ